MELRKDKVLLKVNQYTLRHINDIDDENFGIDASILSLDMNINRTNISRDLNALVDEGKLIKTNGRPTLYISREVINDKFPNSSFPSIIMKGHKISEYIKNEKGKKKKIYIEGNSLETMIGHRTNESMHEAVRKGKAAMLYPGGLNTLIYGKVGTKRLHFANLLFKYGKEKGKFNSFDTPVILDGYATKSLSDEKLEILIFGEYEDGHFKKGLIEKAKNGLLIFEHFDQLSSYLQMKVCSTINLGYYHPANAPRRTIESRTQFIAIQDIEANIAAETLNCFPTTIELPPFEKRTLDELILFALTVFQIEANNINIQISISKSVISCFVMSYYQYNLPQLHAEIKQTCASAYNRSYNENNPLITVTYEDISNNVLNNIYDVDVRKNDLDKTLYLFQNSDFVFYPNQRNNDIAFLNKILDDVDEKIELTFNSSNDLETLCTQDINKNINLNLKNILSTMLKELHDTLYPILKTHPIIKNERLLYGLLNKINEFISTRNSGGFSVIYLDHKTSEYIYCNKIEFEILKKYNYYLSNFELHYISTYLFLSRKYLSNSYIKLLIVVQKGTPLEYLDFIDKYGYVTNYEKIEVNKLNNKEETLEAILQHIPDTNDNHNGVIILSNVVETAHIQEDIKRRKNVKLKVIPEINLSLLLSIIKKMQNINISFEEIINDENDKPETVINSHYIDQILGKIDEYFLQSELTFLDTNKSSYLLAHILLELIQELNIPYSDDLLVKFIRHCSLMLERCIRNDPIKYAKSKSFIASNEYLYSTLEKHIMPLQETYNCIIPSAEISYLAEYLKPLVKEE